MKVKQLVVNGYMIDCAGWFDFDEESKRTTVKIDWGNSESDPITDYLRGIFKRNANQETGEVILGDILIAAHCDGVVFVHKPWWMISGANGNAREFIFKGGFVEAMKEEKPKRMKVEYVKVDYSAAWQAAKDHEERVEFLYRQSDLGEAIKGNNWKAIQSPSEAAQYHFDLYRRIETEIDERQEFIDAAFIIAQECDTEDDAEWMGKLYDSGKFKLVEGE